MGSVSQAPWLKKLGWLIGTGFGSGLFPVAPATAGSVVALSIYYFLPISGDSIGLYLLIVVGFAVGVWATGSLISPEDEDPHRAVWDEFVGLWVTCLFLPKDLLWLGAAFVLFRALDVLKPWPIQKLEHLPSGLGIMADDLLAGVYGAILLNALRLYLSY